jgi:hypothetical protein
LLDRNDRGGSNTASAFGEGSIPAVQAASLSGIRDWEVTVPLSLVVVLVVVLYGAVTGAVSPLVASAVGLALCTAAGVSVLRYRRIQLT